MAARIHKPTPREQKLKIGAKILKRLERFYYADLSDPEQARKYAMSKEQVSAALGALRKYIPDLKCVEFVGDPDKPLIHRIEREIVDPQAQDAASIPPAAE